MQHRIGHLFLFIGADPETDWLKGCGVTLDDHGFVLTGQPRTQWLPETVQLRWGYVLTGRDVVRDGSAPSRWPLDRAPLPLETSVPGVFAVGDARYRSIKRVASAVGDGATAVRLVHEYLDPEPADEPTGEPGLVPEPADESALAAGS